MTHFRKTMKNKRNKRNKRKTKKNRTKKYLKNKKTYKGGGLFDNSFLKCYDTNLAKIQSAIARFSGKHSIDMAIAEQFINEQLSDVRKQAARDLIENTIYITLEEVSSIIEQLIIKLYTENNLNTAENIYIYSGKPEKSFYFMSVLALFYIKKHKFKEPTHFILNLCNELFDTINNAPLIILDDVAYSGSQLSNLLNNIYYNRVVESRKNAPNIFTLLIALNNISKYKLEHVATKKAGVILFDKIESPFKLLFLPDRLYTPLILNVGIERYFNINVFFSLHTISQPHVSIYLDHKIADDVSTYKNVLLYGPIVPSNYDYYNFFQTNYGDIYDFIPSQIECPEITPLINDYLKNNSLKSLTYLPEFIFKKLKDADVLETRMDVINFRPFINSCNQNQELLEITADIEIKNSNYIIFMCFEEFLTTIYNRIKGYTTDNYLAEYIYNLSDKTMTIENFTRKTFEIINKLNTFSCPASWYKNGEFQMKCLSE